jgi:hypothetical protein
LKNSRGDGEVGGDPDVSGDDAAAANEAARPWRFKSSIASLGFFSVTGNSQGTMGHRSTKAAWTYCGLQSSK